MKNKRNYLLYLNDTLVDLSPDTKIAYTIKGVDFSSLVGRASSYSNRIKLPDTDVNAEVFENAENIKANTTVPYKKLTAKLIEDGVETIKDALAIMKGFDDGYDLEIYSAEVDLFDKLKANTLNSTLNAGNSYSAVVDASTIVSMRNSDILGTPVMDQGLLIPALEPMPAINQDNWTSNGPGTNPWTIAYSSGYIGNACSPGVDTEFATTAYKAYNNMRYRITFTIEDTGTNGSRLAIVLQFTKIGPGTDATIVDFDASTGGKKTIQGVIECTADCDNFQIGCVQDAGAGGTALFRISNVSIELIGASELNITAERYIPVVSYMSYIIAAISKAGYVLNYEAMPNTLLDDILFKLVVPFGAEALLYHTDYLERYRFKALAAGGQVINPPTNGDETDVEFTEVILNGRTPYSTTGVPFYDTISKYVVNSLSGTEVVHNLRATFKAKLNVTTTRISGTIHVLLFALGKPGLGNEATRVSFTSSTTNNIFFNLPIDLKDYVHIRVYVSQAITGANAGNQIVINSGEFWVELDPKPIETINYQALNCPDIKCDVLFKDFVTRAALLFKINRGSVYIKSLQQVLSDYGSAVDWSDKRVGPIKINYDNNSYAQENTFEDSSEEPGSLTVANENLVPSQTLYNSPALPVDQKYLEEIQLSSVPIYSKETEATGELSEDYEDGLRLLLLREPLSSDPVIKYEGSTQASYSVAVYNEEVDKRANWSFFLETFYGLVQNVIADGGKAGQAEYDLNTEDIASYDRFKLVYDSGSYYIVSAISKFISGELTKVQLFKVK